MGVVNITNIAGTAPTKVGDRTMEAIFLTAVGEAGEFKARVLAQKPDRWKQGDKVDVIHESGSFYEGPDGLEDWQYIKLDKLRDDGTKFQPRNGGGSPVARLATAPATVAAAPALSFEEARQLYAELSATCSSPAETNALFAAVVAGQVEKPASGNTEAGFSLDGL